MTVDSTKTIPRASPSVGKVAVLAGLVVSGLLFRGLSHRILPSMQNPFSPPPDAAGVWLTANDPSRGSKLPGALKSVQLPTVVVVHSACLSCSLEAYGKAERAFKAPGVVNVVAAALETYGTLIGKHPDCRVVIANEALAKSMNALFSPRVYAFDRTGRLIYEQSDKEGFDDAITTARSTIGTR